MAGAKVDPSFALKITPPKARRASAPRAWLARNGSVLRDRGIGLIHAPGGYGKTTLLADWRREVLAQGTIAGWLLLDSRDDGARFLSGLVACLRAATGDPKFAAIAAQTAKQTGAELDALTLLLADIIALASPVALLLDDVHELPPSTTETLVPYLMYNRPPNLQLVFGSRQPLSVATSELAAGGELAVVAARDLRLKLDETIELLRMRFRNAIDLDVCARVHEIAEGWPIAVQLLAALIESNPSVDLTRVTSGSQDIGRFFEETVLSRLAPNEAEFIVDCSVLDALHPDLCRVMTGNAHASTMLDRLQRATPILTTVEGSVWLRMHPLARSAFAPRFDKLAEAHRHELHWQAAQWLHDKGEPEAAARHALAAGRAEIAYEWMGAHLYALLLGGHVSEVLAWAERLPPEVIAQPTVRLGIAWANALSYQREAALHQVDALGNDVSDEVKFERDMIRAVLAIYADDLELAARALEPWGDESPFGRVTLRQSHANIAAYLMIEKGDTERARYRQALLHASRTEGSFAMPQVHGDMTVALSYLAEGRPRLAEQTARPTLERIDAMTGRRSAASCILAPALAAACWEQDRRDDAESALAHRIDVVERTGVPEAVAIGYTILARLALASGREAAALDVLSHLQALGEERRQPRLVIASLVEQIRVHAPMRRGETCEMLVERLDAVLAGELRKSDRYAALREMAYARARIATSDFDVAAKAIAKARSLARKARRTRDWLEARVLFALVSDPHDPETVASLRESLSIAEANGLVRLFVDAHPQLLDVLRKFVETQPPADVGASQAFVQLVLGGPPRSSERSVTPREAARPRERVAAQSLLTAKEAAILELVSAGMSNKEIARAVDVGQETVKWHLKNLFGKLHAASRRHAVDRARVLGLLSA
jgi:LuxR family maltose regulon positive regulatory protein